MTASSTEREPAYFERLEQMLAGRVSFLLIRDGMGREIRKSIIGVSSVIKENLVSDGSTRWGREVGRRSIRRRMCRGRRFQKHGIPRSRSMVRAINTIIWAVFDLEELLLCEGLRAP